MNNSVTGSEGRNWLWMMALLFLVLLAGNGKLLRGKVAPQWDAVSFFAPEFSLVVDHAKAGRLLLWDPWVAAGSPELAEPELGATSPLMMLVGAAFPSPLTGFIAYWMLIWAGAAVGMLLFARHLGSPPWGGVVAALGFVASGFFVGHAQHTSSLLSVAFLPWICWRFDDFLLRRRYWSAVQAGVLYGLSALGGYPQFTILTPGFLAIWAMGRILFADRAVNGRVVTLRLGKHNLPAVFGALALVGLIGGLVFCPPYASILSETRGYSDRVGERSRSESIGSNVLPAAAVATLASPYLFLLNYPGIPGQLWPFSDISMSNIYCGAAVSVLSFLALLSRSRWRFWIGSIALFFLCCSLGNQLPLRGWLYDYVMPTRYFRGPSMFSAYSIFLVCVLSALAARDLGEDAHSRGQLALRFLVTAIFAALIAGLSFWVLFHRAPARPFRPSRAIEHLAFVWTAMVLAALLYYFRRLGSLRWAHMLVIAAALDSCIAIVIAGPAMYSTATVPWWKIMSQRHVSSLDLAPHQLDRQLFPPEELMYGSVVNNRNLPLKIATLDNYIPLRSRFQSASVADPALRMFSLGKNRIWFSDQQFVLPPNDVTFAAYSAVAHASVVPPLVLHSPMQMLRFSSASQPSRDNQAAGFLHSAQPLVPASIELLTYLPNTLAFKYFAEKDGWLLVTDRWAPGWSATVNGSPAEVLGANFVFRAVRVLRGENTVRFDYRPRGYIAMVILSWGVLLAFGICEIWRFTRRVRARKTARLIPQPDQASA